MTLQEQHQQDMNDKKTLKGLMIQLSLPSLDLPINKPKLSVSMTLKVLESLQYRIWEIDNKYEQLDQDNDDDTKSIEYPTQEQLEDEYRLTEEWNAIVLASQ